MTITFNKTPRSSEPR